MAVERTAEGWTITGSGQLGPPVDMLTNTLRIRYDENWKPLGVNVGGAVRGVATSLRTTVDGTTARSDASAGDAPEAKVDTIDPSAVLLLPGPFIAPYEAVAFRLKTAAPGTVVPAYISSQVPITLRVGESSSVQIQTLARVIDARRTTITFEVPGMPPSDAEVWADENGRLLRLTVPDQGLDAVRADIASVSARRVTVSRPGDTQVTIPANGFSLAGTISKPAAATATPLPAVVPWADPGWPIAMRRSRAFPSSDLPGTLPMRVVLRFDKRGIGSGGRAESATVSDYAEDARAVRFMAARRDVDGGGSPSPATPREVRSRCWRRPGRTALARSC